MAKNEAKKVEKDNVLTKEIFCGMLNHLEAKGLSNETREAHGLNSAKEKDHKR